MGHPIRKAIQTNRSASEGEGNLECVVEERIMSISYFPITGCRSRGADHPIHLSFTSSFRISDQPESWKSCSQVGQPEYVELVNLSDARGGL